MSAEANIPGLTCLGPHLPYHKTPGRTQELKAVCAGVSRGAVSQELQLGAPLLDPARRLSNLAVRNLFLLLIYTAIAEEQKLGETVSDLMEIDVKMRFTYKYMVPLMLQE